NELFLVDPPGRLREGAHLWDFAVFRSSMRRHLWNFTLRRPFDRRRAIITQSLAAFDRSYLGSLTERPREPALFALAARLFALHPLHVGTRARRRSHDQFSLRARSNSQATLTRTKLSLIGASGRRGQPLIAVFRSFKIR